MISKRSQSSRGSVVEILRRARARIEDPERWGQGRGPFGEIAAGTECAYTALYEADQSMEPARHYLAEAMDTDSLIKFNDSHSHAEVLAAFDKAIALADTASQETG